MLPPPSSALSRMWPNKKAVVTQASSHAPAVPWSRRMSHSLRDYATAMRRIFLLQLDYVASQRLRRTCALVGHYSRLWERERLRQILRQMGRQLFGRHGRSVA